MDSDRIEGTAQELGGKVKDAVGGLTGDTSLQAEGKADQGMGQLKAFGGKAADFARKQPLLAAGITLVVGMLLGREASDKLPERVYYLARFSRTSIRDLAGRTCLCAVS